MPTQSSRALRILPIALPLAGMVVGPLMFGDFGDWIIRSISGALIGLSLSFMLWKARTVPPYSIWLGGASAGATCIALLVMALFAWNSDLGTYVVIAMISVGFGWAGTR
jgi:hypothetical protein